MDISGLIQEPIDEVKAYRVVQFNAHTNQFFNGSGSIDP